MDVRIAQKGPGRDGGHCRDTRVWHAALSQVQGGPTPRTPGDCAHRFGEVYPPPALPASSSPCASLRRGQARWLRRSHHQLAASRPHAPWLRSGRSSHHPTAGTARTPLAPARGSCTWPLRVNTSDSPIDRYRDKKVWTRELSWPPSGPRPPGDDLDAGRADTRRPLRSAPLTASPPSRCAHTPAGCGHGGPRKSSTSRSVQTWSVRPAAIAGVHGRHCVVEPVPWVDSGCGRGWRTLAWGKQKL
jgi:hypothetical protein